MLDEDITEPERTERENPNSFAPKKNDSLQFRAENRRVNYVIVEDSYQLS